MDGPQLLTIRQVAALLAVSVGTVRNMVRRGELAAPRKLAGRVARWFPSDVRECLRKLKYQQSESHTEEHGSTPSNTEGQSRRKPRNDA